MRIIKDLVHEYIEISEEVKRVIDTPSFQRLKNISQLTSYHLFPSVNHTRFEHSLGVMKLAMDFFDSIEKQLCGMVGDNHTVKITYLRENLRYASLLHDVGHAPFSHLGESFYKKDEIVSNIKKEVTQNDIKIDLSIFSAGSAHEKMSCYCILRNYRDILLKLETSIDLEFIFRIIIGKKYTTTDKWAENIIIGILNSNTADVDKLDYLLRDNHMAGYPAQKIDVKRLLNSLYIDKTKELTYKSNGIASVQSLIDSRDALYLWVYNHHTAVYTDYIVHDLLKHFIELSAYKGTYPEEMKWEDYFSCEAICENFVSDADLYAHLNKAYVLSLKGKTSTYSTTVLPQLFERKFLKPTWKTVYEYLAFEENSFTDKKTIEKLYTDLIEDSEVANDRRRKIVKLIMEKLKLDYGNVFFIIRSNKFYFSKNNSKFYIFLEGKGNQPISSLLPQKNYEKFKDISFYLFGPQGRINDITKEFVQIIDSQEYNS